MVRIAAMIVLLCMCVAGIGISAEAKTDSGHVLATDTDHNGVLNQNTIKEGHDYILVKQNPTALDDSALTFITNKDGIVTTAAYKDLDNPAAFKQIFIAQVTPSGTLKIFTLANVGYLKIYTEQKSPREKNYYLLTDKGTMDRVESVEYDNSVPNFRSQDDANAAKLASIHLPTLENPNYFKNHSNLDVKVMLQKIKMMMPRFSAPTRD